MIKFDDVTKEYIKKHNTNWPQIPDHPYKIGGSGSELLIQFNKSATKY